MKLIRTTILGAAVALAGGLLAAPQPPAAEQPPTFKTGTEEVILDVVVRDKKGKPITDVAPEDLTITDNGVKQTITGFRRVEGREAMEKGTKVPLDAMKQLRLVTFVFEQLSEQGRRLSRQAANKLVNDDQATNVFYSVVAISTQLYAIQEFTNDKAKLAKAIEQATSGQNLTLASQSEKVKSSIREHLQAGGATMAVTSRSDPASAAVQGRLASILNDMLKFESAGNESTRTSIFALLSLVRGQYAMPGRKTIMYFSEGMDLQTHLDEPFRSITSTANRGNVTIYAVDTRGVGAASNEEAAKEMREAGRLSMEGVTRDDGRVSIDEIKAGDRSENSMRKNTQLPLRTLSESTGGFLVGESNDLRVPLKQVNEEINSYYEVSYDPKIENYDGKFRATKVETARKELVVHSRTGYFALPATVRGSTMLPYEFAILKAMDSATPPKDIEFRAGAMRFQPSKTGMTGSVIIEVPMKAVTFTEDQTAKKFKARISLVALLKDEKGEIVQKLSRDLPLSGALAQVPQMKMGNFIYKEQFTVPAGKYTLEAGVIDHEANKLSVKKAPFLAAVHPGVAISSLTQVRNYEANAKNLDPADPYQFQGGKITPNLAGTVYVAKGVQLSLFFVVYPDPAISEKPALQIEYLMDGQSLAKADLPLPAPDVSGKIPYVFTSPAENLPPGTYEIKAIVKQGSTTADDKTQIIVATR